MQSCSDILNRQRTRTWGSSNGLHNLIIAAALGGPSVPSYDSSVKATSCACHAYAGTPAGSVIAEHVSHAYVWREAPPVLADLLCNFDTVSRPDSCKFLQARKNLPGWLYHIIIALALRCR
jgi:hypothetical protein